MKDGIYLNLPFAQYVGDDRLGSTDMGSLSRNGLGWWWQSRHNPDKVEKDRKHLAFGTALHTLLLEGLVEYEGQYAVMPDPKAYTVLKTKADMREALIGQGVKVLSEAALKVPEWADLCRIHLPPDIVFWPNVESDFDLLRGERMAISAYDDRCLRLMRSMIENDTTKAGEEVRDVLGFNKPWPVLAEVSYMWTDDKGVRRRARFDRIVPNFTLDLKSLGNWSGRSLQYAVPDHISKFSYDVQVGDQHVARTLMMAELREKGEDCIIGGTPDQRNWLHAIAVANKPWAWVWLFYQVPDPEGRAPVVFPVWEDWKGPHHMSGHRKAIRARDLYLEGVKRFGLDNPWGQIEPLHYTSEGHATSLPINHWNMDMEAVDGEEILDR